MPRRPNWHLKAPGFIDRKLRKRWGYSLNSDPDSFRNPSAVLLDQVILAQILNDFSNQSFNDAFIGFGIDGF